MVKKNLFSFIVALIIMYLCMTNAHNFDKVPLVKIPNFDKLVHFGMELFLGKLIQFLLRIPKSAS